MTPAQILLILRKRFWIIVLALISTIAGAGGIMLLVPPRYDAIATASIDPGQLDPVTGQSTGASSLLRILQGNLVALAQSQRVAADVAKRLNLARDPAIASAYNRSGLRDRVGIEDWIASEYLLKSVEARFTEGSNILTIKYKTKSPTQAALIANTFLSAFIDAAVEMKTNSAQQTASWFDPQMEKMKADLKLARDKLTKFQREAKIIAANGNADSENSQLVAVTNELSNAKSQLLLLNSQTTGSDQAKGKTKDSALLPESPTLLALKTNLATVNADIARALGEVGEGNPKIINLRATKRSLETQIRGEIASREKALKEQIQFLERARAEQLQRMISVQAQRDQLSSLQHEVELRQEQIDNAGKVAGTARLQSRLSFLNISILDKATPPSSAAFPKFKIVIPLALGAGGALGVILALLAEALDRRIRVPADLEFAASAPVLGTLLSPTSQRRLLGGLQSRLTRATTKVLPGSGAKRWAAADTRFLRDQRSEGRTPRTRRSRS